ncbi:MAG: helix-turn-helix transcriptional regulator [Acidimicrobiia bacterium]|nr:helix-turn-helix transcriptional regulator [Acidimicrobiia bacterium]
MTAQRKEEPPCQHDVEAAVETLKLLADPTRLRILRALLHGENAVNPLAAHVGARPAAVSQHLAKLRMARLVQSRRDGNRVLYSADDPHLSRLIEEALSHADHVVRRRAGHGVGRLRPKGRVSA